ncbi:hypothetical protein NP493_5804g00004, partial [Ridgeia piscesae]
DQPGSCSFAFRPTGRTGPGKHKAFFPFRSVGRSFVRDARSYARPNAAAAPAIPFSRPAAAAPRSRARSRMHATTSTTTARPFFHTPFESSVRRPNSQDRQVGIEFTRPTRSTRPFVQQSSAADRAPTENPFRNVCRDEHEFAQPKYGNRPMRDRARTETCESAPKAGNQPLPTFINRACHLYDDTPKNFFQNDAHGHLASPRES